MSPIILFQKRKSISIKIHQGQLIVKAPFKTPLATIDSIIQKYHHKIKYQIQIEQNKLITDTMLLFGKVSVTLSVQQRNKELFEVIEKMVSDISKKLNIKIKEIKLRELKAAWGNCRKNGTITFSKTLIHVPYEIIYSVVAHEMCHLIHFNHSKAFYELLVSICPNYFLLNQLLNQGQWDRYKWSDTVAKTLSQAEL